MFSSVKQNQFISLMPRALNSSLRADVFQVEFAALAVGNCYWNLGALHGIALYRFGYIFYVCKSCKN